MPLLARGPGFGTVVSESSFFNLETRMRVSPIQSRSSRRDREFLRLTLRLRDETEKKFLPISGIETRSRFIIFTPRLRDENENSLDLISFFETRPRILKLPIFLKSGLNGITILHAIFGRLTLLNGGPHILLDALDLLELLGFLAFLALLSFRVSFVLLALLSLHDFLSLHLIPY